MVVPYKGFSAWLYPTKVSWEEEAGSSGPGERGEIYPAAPSLRYLHYLPTASMKNSNPSTWHSRLPAAACPGLPSPSCWTPLFQPHHSTSWVLNPPGTFQVSLLLLDLFGLFVLFLPQSPGIDRSTRTAGAGVCRLLDHNHPLRLSHSLGPWALMLSP